jgi:hypothetical protein
MSGHPTYQDLTAWFVDNFALADRLATIRFALSNYVMVIGRLRSEAWKIL